MAYDFMDYGVGYDPTVDEEERKKREKELANAGPVVPDQTDAETQRLLRQNAQPAGQMAVAPEQVAVQPQAGAGRGFVNPALVQAQPVNPQAFNQEQYNASIQQQESGNRPNIGYHNQKLGTAYGPYGITAGAWADARRANPNLPEDITKATPEQMTAAQNTVTANNAKYLQSFGVDVTPQTLAAAHFLGAKGLADYLKDGTISKAAAAANGGEENVRRIVQQRLGGQAAPASGAAPLAEAAPAEQTTQPVNPLYALGTGQTGLGLRAPMQGPAPTAGIDTSKQYIDQYQAVQNDPLSLLKLRNDETAPQFIRERAGRQAYDLMDRQVKLNDEQQRVQGLLQASMQGDPKASKEIANELSSKAVTMGKFVLAKLFAPELAKEYAIDLGFGNVDKPVDVNGKAALITYDARGKPLSGVWADQTKMTKEDLINASSNVLEKGVHVTKVTQMIDPETKQLVTHQTLSDGKERYTMGGATFTGDKSKLVNAEEHVKQEDRRVNAGYANLAKLTTNPTTQQKYQALRDAGVPNSRIEQELGVAAGSLTGKTPTTMSAEPEKAQAAPAATGKTPGTTVLPSGRAFDPNRPPEALPGQSKTAHEADVKTWEARKKTFDKDVEAYGTIENSAASTIADIDKLLTHPGLGSITGLTGAFPNIPGSQASNAQADLDKIKGGTFLTALRSMKGSGSVSNIEGDKAQAAIANLSQKQDVDQFKKNLIEYKNTIMRNANVAAAAIGEPLPYPNAPKAGNEVSDVRKRADAIIGR